MSLMKKILGSRRHLHKWIVGELRTDLMKVMQAGKESVLEVQLLTLAVILSRSG